MGSLDFEVTRIGFEIERSLYGQHQIGVSFVSVSTAKDVKPASTIVGYNRKLSSNLNKSHKTTEGIWVGWSWVAQLTHDSHIFKKMMFKTVFHTIFLFLVVTFLLLMSLIDLFLNIIYLIILEKGWEGGKSGARMTTSSSTSSKPKTLISSASPQHPISINHQSVQIVHSFKYTTLASH